MFLQATSYKLIPAPIYPKSVQNLITLLTRLPGIGPRQAARFAFFILKENGNYAGDLALALKDLTTSVASCTQCFRSMEKRIPAFCQLCADTRRNPGIIAVVEKESDMQNLERTGAFGGLYHVLGGTISAFDQDSPKKIHLRDLYDRIKRYLEGNGACEVVLATNPTTEGDTTALYIEQVLKPLKEKFPGLATSRLGRGLSLGSELEHVDEITLKTAFINRR